MSSSVTSKKTNFFNRFSSYKYIMTGLVVCVVVVNAIQAVAIDRELPFHLQAFHVNNSDNITELAEGLTNISNVHNLYFAIQQQAKGAKLYADKSAEVLDNRNFLSGVYGIGDISTIEEIPIREKSRRQLKSIDSSSHRVIKGEIWNNPGHPRQGIPGKSWTMVLPAKNEPADALIMIESENSPNYYFVDIGLLPGEIKRGLGI